MRTTQNEVTFSMYYGFIVLGYYLLGSRQLETNAEEILPSHDASVRSCVHLGGQEQGMTPQLIFGGPFQCILENDGEKCRQSVQKSNQRFLNICVSF